MARSQPRARSEELSQLRKQQAQKQVRMSASQRRRWKWGEIMESLGDLGTDFSIFSMESGILLPVVAGQRIG
jgi:hypothetical protein